MKSLSTTARRRLRHAARIGSGLSAYMLIATGLSLVGDPTADAALQGAVSFQDPVTAVKVTAGGSEPFAMTPPQNAACPGGASETPSYRWQTFFVEASVDASALTYSDGPVNPGTSFVWPLFDSAENPVVDKNPSSNPKGLITGIPTISFRVFVNDLKPEPGQYKLGIACTLDGATVSHWQTIVVIADDETDDPAGISWAVETTTTTTTSTTSTTSTTTTSTTAPGGSSTTVAGATTTSTTTPGATTTAVAGSTSTSTTLVASAAASGSTGSGVTFGNTSGSGGALPVAGPSGTMKMIVWSLLMLLFGRMAILLGRPIRVVSSDSR